MQSQGKPIDGDYDGEPARVVFYQDGAVSDGIPPALSHDLVVRTLPHSLRCLHRDYVLEALVEFY